MVNETIDDRLERAQAEEMTLSVSETDPVIVLIHNKDSDRVHTVVPSATHCSCEDQTYRSRVCKHMLTCLLDDGEVGSLMAESLRTEREDMQERMADLNDELSSLKAQRKQISSALDAADVRHIADDTIEQMADGIRAEQEAHADPETDEVDAFGTMIAEMTDDETGGDA